MFTVTLFVNYFSAMIVSYRWYTSPNAAPINAAYVDSDEDENNSESEGNKIEYTVHEIEDEGPQPSPSDPATVQPKIKNSKQNKSSKKESKKNK